MMATSASLSIFCNSSMNYWRLYPAKKLKGPVKFLFGKQSYVSNSWVKPSFPIRLSREGKDQTPSVESNGPLMLQEDLNYVLQLGAGSIVGAAIIKYGSAFFPDITRPNILQALVIIFAPVVVAVFLLIKQSSDNSR